MPMNTLVAVNSSEIHAHQNFHTKNATINSSDQEIQKSIMRMLQEPMIEYFDNF